MTPVQRNIAYVATVVSLVLMSVTATRDFVVELAATLGVIVYFGLLVLWNVVTSVDGDVFIGIVTGLAFVAAAIAAERHGQRARDRAYADAPEED